MLKETTIISNGILFQKGVEEVLPLPSTDPKMKTRLKIEQEVFDIEDSVADNAKWLSLLTTLLSRIYSILPEDQKSELKAEDRALVEGVFTMFSATNTRGDIQFSKEGPAMIQKIMSRQAQIGEIVK